MRILITGNRGFIGKHLVNNIKYRYSNKLNILHFDKKDFNSNVTLDQKVKRSSVIVHLAGLNRHKDESKIYEVNINLTNLLIESISRTGFTGKLIFISSIQEKQNNNYGKSKKESRNLFIKASKKYKFTFSGYILPNVFGPFGKVNYNSFIPTFCEKILNNDKFDIIENKKIELIYIDKVINEIVSELNNNNSISKKEITPDIKITVDEVRMKLLKFYAEYIENNTIPDISTEFDLNLFNTFRSYIKLNKFYPSKLKQNKDDRGNFIEILRNLSMGQCSYSITKPGVTRGNHFHTRKIERFSVIRGQALIQLRKIDSDEIFQFNLDGNSPSFIDMPIWFTHNIKNIGKDDLITLFWINEPYDFDNPDTYIEKV